MTASIQRIFYRPSFEAALILAIDFDTTKNQIKLLQLSLPYKLYVILYVGFDCKNVVVLASVRPCISSVITQVASCVSSCRSYIKEQQVNKIVIGCVVYSWKDSQTSNTEVYATDSVCKPLTSM